MAKTFIGVVHLPAIAAALSSGIEELVDSALGDARALAEGGVDGIIVENLGDVPFHKGTRDDPVPPHVPSMLAIVAREVQRATGVRVGINCLRNDGVAALGAAAAAAASFVRVNVFTGAYVTDQGLIEAEAARVLAYRRHLGLDAKVLILADHMVKHAAPLAIGDPVVAAKDLAERSGADVMVLSGKRTGEPVDGEFLAAVRAAIGDFPIWIGSGLTEQNAPELMGIADGAIVGTALKVGGKLAAAIDPARVARLRQLIRGA